MKKVSALLAMLMAVFCLASCSNDSSDVKEVKLTEVYDAIAEKMTLPAMYDMSADQVSEQIGIPADSVKQGVYKRSEDASKVDQMIMVEAVDEEKAKEINELLISYRKSLVDQSTNYDASAAKILEGCSVRQDGNFVCLLITENASEASQIYGENIK